MSYSQKIIYLPTLTLSLLCRNRGMKHYQCNILWIVVLLKQLSRYHETLYLACALVYLRDPGVPVVALRRHIPHVPHTA